MSKGTCIETFSYEFFSVYYNDLHNSSNLDILKDFLKHTESNISYLIKEFKLTGHISSILKVRTKDGFDTQVLDNDVIILKNILENDYEILDYDDFESIYTIDNYGK